MRLLQGIRRCLALLWWGILLTIALYLGLSALGLILYVLLAVIARDALLIPAITSPPAIVFFVIPGILTLIAWPLALADERRQRQRAAYARWIEEHWDELSAADQAWHGQNLGGRDPGPPVGAWYVNDFGPFDDEHGRR
jgi:hypothetical protein